MRTKGLSTLHLELFEQLLYSGLSNWDLNIKYGYTKRSHAIVDHTRKVMRRLLAMEDLQLGLYSEQVIYPRLHGEWWKRLLAKHEAGLRATIIEALYYEV